MMEASALTPSEDQTAVAVTQPKREFFGALESLRGLAALAVVLYHVPGWYEPFSRIGLARNGHAAVEFFFVLSGFVLYHSYGTRISGAGSFKRFVVLRLARLYPVHFVFTIAFFAIELAKFFGGASLHVDSGNPPATLHSILRALLENLILVQGLGLAPREIFLNFPSWSISTEFYTYLIFGAAVWLASRRSFIYFSIGMTALCCVTLTLVGDRVGEFQQMLRCTGGFFLGCLTRIAYGKINSWNTRVDWTGLMLVGTLILLSLDWRGRTDTWQFAFPLSACLVLSLVLSPDSKSARLLSTRPFRWLGQISYSLYMCHALVLYVARHLLSALLKPAVSGAGPITSLSLAVAVYGLTFALVIGGGWVTFLLIENPGKRWVKALSSDNAR